MRSDWRRTFFFWHARYCICSMAMAGTGIKMTGKREMRRDWSLHRFQSRIERETLFLKGA
jgi:hypothetical protein